jgi:hypothetical protein
VLGEAALRVRWNAAGSELVLDANLSPRPVDAQALEAQRVVWTEGPAEAATLGPWSVRWSVVADRA